MMANEFEREYRLQHLDTAGASEFEIPSDWLIWGDFMDVQANSDRVGGTKWNAFFLLVRPDGDLSNRKVDIEALRARSLVGGNSTFRIDPQMLDPRIKDGHVPVPFILRRGEHNALAAIELHDFEDGDLIDAVLLARTYFNILNATFVHMFNLPLMFKALHVARADDPDVYALRVFMPWAEAEIFASNFETPAGIATRLMLMYAEGVTSNSQVYRFLCFFKVVDHVLRVGGPALKKMQRTRFANAPWLNLDDHLLPDDFVGRFDVLVAGATYREAYDRYRRTQLRNAAAHVLESDQAFEPLDPAHAAHYRAAASIFRYMGQQLIRVVTLNAKAMLDHGASSEELMATFYPKTKAKR